MSVSFFLVVKSWAKKGSNTTSTPGALTASLTGVALVASKDATYLAEVVAELEPELLTGLIADQVWGDVAWKEAVCARLTAGDWPGSSSGTLLVYATDCSTTTTY